MKSIIKITLVITSILSLFACTKEIEIESSFPFVASLKGEKNALITDQLTTTLEIIPERVVDNVKYFFSYDSSSKGYYTLKSEVLEENTEYIINSFSEELIYTPTEDGTHLVNFELRDSNGQESSSSIEYNITEGDDLSFTAAALIDEINIDETTVIQLSIDEIDSDIVNEELTYTLFFNSTDANSTILFNSDTYSPNDLISGLEASNFNVTYQPTTSGTQIINLEIEASNGKVFTQQIIITVNATDFDFVFEPANDESILGVANNIFFEIEQTSNEELTYTIDISGKEGYLKSQDSGTNSLPRTFSNQPNTSNVFTFYPLEVESNNFVVTVTASNGVQKTKQIAFNSLPLSFDFTLSTTTMTLYNTSSKKDFYDGFTLNLELPDTIFINPEYDVTLLSEVGGFTIIGIDGTKFPGDIMNLNEGNEVVQISHSANLEFFRTIAESGKITVIVENDTGFRVEKTIDVTVITD